MFSKGFNSRALRYDPERKRKMNKRYYKEQLKFTKLYYKEGRKLLEKWGIV